MPNELSNQIDVTITNAMGIKVLELKNVDINNPIDMNVLAVGIYTITIMHQGAMIYNTKVSKL